MKIVPTYIDKRAATVDIPYPEAEPAHLKLDVPMGRIMLDPGAGESIISGKVTYNIEEFKPTYSVKGRTVQIRQRQRFLFPIGVKFVNDWEFMLGDASPFSLEVNTGAAQAELNLGGIPLTGLTAESGAGDLAVNFDMPNPARIKQAKISTGAGRATLKGLLNANVERLKIGAGVGQFIAHFTGAGLIESGKVRIDGGVGGFAGGVNVVPQLARRFANGDGHRGIAIEVVPIPR